MEHKYPSINKDNVRSGDVAQVNITVPLKVLFEWSDKIVANYDEDSGDTEYTSGYVMNVLPQTIVYNGEKGVVLYQTMPEK